MTATTPPAKAARLFRRARRLQRPPTPTATPSSGLGAPLGRRPRSAGILFLSVALVTP